MGRIVGSVGWGPLLGVMVWGLFAPLLLADGITLDGLSAVSMVPGRMPPAAS